jgi:hypothetical protein
MENSKQLTTSALIDAYHNELVLKDTARNANEEERASMDEEERASMDAVEHSCSTSKICETASYYRSSFTIFTKSIKYF